MRAVRPEGFNPIAAQYGINVAQMLASLGDPGFIAEVVGNWDSATITEKLELRVGSDLQYVRVNGTLVGFLVGGLLYAVLRALFGPVAF